MSLLLGITIGIVSGLIPGLHSNLILMGIASIFQVDVVTIVTAYGASMYTHRLSHVFHPTASTNLASLAPAQRLMHRGKGPEALELMLLATTRSSIFLIGILVTLVLISAYTHLDYSKVIQNSKTLGILIIIGWVLFTCFHNSEKHEVVVYDKKEREANPAWTQIAPNWYVEYHEKNPGMIFIGFCLTGLYGYYILHQETFRGSEYSMLVILNGLVAIPIIYHTLQEKKSHIPLQFPSNTITERKDLALLGTITGCVAAIIAGIGSSSLVTLFQHKTESDQEYIYLAACAETANNLLAFILVVLLGVTRSGEAVLIKQTGTLDISLIAWLAVSMAIGYVFTKEVSKDYVQMSRQIPVKMSAGLVGLIAIGTIFMSGHPLMGSIYVIVGVLITNWCKKNNLPNQVLFGCMIFPILANQLGLVPMINKLLFIN